MNYTKKMCKLSNQIPQREPQTHYHKEALK